MVSETSKLVLASASPRRLDLLATIGLIPDEVLPANVDETPNASELPRAHVRRLAEAKASVIAALRPGSIVLAADTVVACGRRILPKAEDEAQARQCLELLSGRRHRVFTSVCVIDRTGNRRTRTVHSIVRFKRLTKSDVVGYLHSGEWRGKAGGYAIQGCAGAFIPWISGSHSAIVGLPLAETAEMLSTAGLAVVRGNSKL